MPTRRSFLALLACSSSSAPAWAWQGPTLAWQGPGAEPAPDFRFSTGVAVVNILATVRDRDGRIVDDLTIDDFTLEEAGRPQQIQYFSQQTGLPLILGLLIDTSGSVRDELRGEVRASRRFLRQVLRPDQDRAFLIQFANQIELLQNLTADRLKLDDALAELDPGFQMPRWLQLGVPGAGGGRQRGQRGRQRGRTGGRGTGLYDAVFLSADDVMQPEPGRKAVILLTDGLDQGSIVSLNTAIEAAQRADTLVYSIRFGDGEAPLMRTRGGVVLPGEPGETALSRMSRETGGSYFDTSRRQPLEDIFEVIEEELRNQYNLGFTPSEPGAGYRQVRVRVNRPGLTVRARDGYYGPE